MKTATLFRWCLWAPFVALETDDSKIENLTKEMGTILGTLFQRSDDLLDFDVRNKEGKLVLGDLKSGYLNSFATYSTSEWSTEARLQLKTVESLQEFKGLLGEKEFVEKVQRFDSLNSNLIDLYDHHLGELKALLPDSQSELIENLKPLADLLYWRGEKKGGA